MHLFEFFFFPRHAWLSANQFLTGSHRSSWIYGHRASPARSPYCTIFYFYFWNPMFRNIPVISVWTCTPCIIYIYTWHDMTWHDMTWHGMTWHSLHYVRTYIRTYLHTYVYLHTCVYLHTYCRYVPTYLHPCIRTFLHPSIHPSIHIHGTCFMALFYAQVRSIESQRNSPGFPVFSSKSSKRPHHQWPEICALRDVSWAMKVVKPRLDYRAWALLWVKSIV